MPISDWNYDQLRNAIHGVMPDGVSLQVKIELETGKPSFSVGFLGKPEQETVNPFVPQFEAAAHGVTSGMDMRDARTRDEASDMLMLNIPNVKEVVWVDFNKKVVL